LARFLQEKIDVVVPDKIAATQSSEIALPHNARSMRNEVFTTELALTTYSQDDEKKSEQNAKDLKALASCSVSLSDLSK
jgi:hypothetical protein